MLARLRRRLGPGLSPTAFDLLIVAMAFSLELEHPEECYPPYLGYFVGDRPEDAQCASNAGLTFLDAAQWRTGKHFEQVFADTLRPR